MAVLSAMVFATSCSDSDYRGGDSLDEVVSFAVIPADWQVMGAGRSVNKAAGNAVHTRENIEGSDYTLHTVIERNGLGDEQGSRALVTTLDVLKSSGFEVNAIVENKATGNKQLLMRETAVNYNGSAWTYSPLKYWPKVDQYKTSFYAYRLSDFTSATYEGANLLPTLKYTVPVDPTAQKDIVTAQNDNNDRKPVDLAFEHRMTTVRVKTRHIDRPIIRLEFTGIYDNATFDLTTMTWQNVKFSDENPEGIFRYRFVGSQLIGESGAGEVYVPDEGGSEYYFMMLPQDLGAAGRDARVKVLFDNGTIVTASLKQNWEAGTSVTYIFSYDDVTCQWLEDANCYLINPIKTSNRKDVNLFAIPISFRINSFWQNEAGVKPLTGGVIYAADVIWQDRNERMIDFGESAYSDATGSYNHYTTTAQGDGDDEYLYFKLHNPDFTGTANIVVGVRLASAPGGHEGEYLWSWHLWLTDYYPIPDVAYELNTAARVSVPGGSIERYDEGYNVPEPSWSVLRNRYLMDRNIGAKAPSTYDGTMTSFENSRGMYYQVGRKDPFPPNGTLYHIDGSSVVGTLAPDNAVLITSKNLRTTADYNLPLIDMVKYPMQFVRYDTYERTWMYEDWRNPSWYPEGAGDGKSFYDPCPPGWKLPDKRIFDIFHASQTYVEGWSGFAVYTSPDSRAQAKELFYDGSRLVCLRLYMDRAKTMTTDYMAHGQREPYSGLEHSEINTLLWLKNSHIFQPTNGGALSECMRPFNHPNQVYGGQVRAIHE